MTVESAPTGEDLETHHKGLRIVKGRVRGVEEPLDDFVAELAARMQNDFDFLVIVTGARGRGKSTLAIELARRVDASFTMERIVFSPSEILPLHGSLKPGQVMIVDEVGEAWSSGDWATKINKTLAKAFTGNRYRREGVIFCLPHFKRVDSSLRGMAQYLIEVKSRRLAVVYDLNHDYFSGTGMPYRHTRFFWTKRPLPKWVYREYHAVKTDRGEERLAEYQRQILGEISTPIDPDEVLKIVAKDAASFVSHQGWVSADMIHAKWSAQGISKSKARSIAQQVSRITRPAWQKKNDEAKAKVAAKKTRKARDAKASPKTKAPSKTK